MKSRIEKFKQKVNEIAAQPKTAAVTQIAFAIIVSGLMVIANATQVFACFEGGWFDRETEESKARLLDIIKK